MRYSLRQLATAAGSVAVLVAVILLVSADAGTVVALAAICLSGLLVHRTVGQSELAAAARSRLSSRTRLILGTLVVFAVIGAVSDGSSEAIVLGMSALFGFVGFRAGSVLRGGLYGTVGGILVAITLVCIAGVALLVATLIGVDGTRKLALKTLIAPQIAGFVTVVWTAFVVALGGVIGLVSGSVGGALARLY